MATAGDRRLRAAPLSLRHSAGGHRSYRLPVEVIPFAAGFCRRRLADADHAPVLRESGGEEMLRAVPGVVGTGLFLGMAQTVLVWDQARVTTLTRTAAPPSAAR
jgi:ribose 5-phosphate isomerase